MESTVFDETESPVQQFYANRSVFVTGGTGFIGKVLIEKLLRCCPDIERVYMLIRPKKGMSPEERFEKLLEKECFEPLKEKFPNFKEKITLVVGDVTEALCGISDEDFENLQRDVSIVFHSAADVHFVAPIRTAALQNVTGTRHVLELCKKLPLLDALIHVSTAFARRNPDHTVPEEVGGCHAHPNEVQSLLKILDDDSLKKVVQSIVKDKLTPYQFSKALAELVLDEEKENIPVAIVRPCVVTSAWKEPLPGWCDIFQGLSGLVVAGGKGFFRVVYAPPGFRLLLIPVDVVVNAIIATGWHFVTTRKKDTFVVNCTMKYEDFPIGEEFLQFSLNLNTICPTVSRYRYPHFTVHHQKWLCNIHATVDHYIPAIIIDAFLFIFTGKTLMMPLYRRINTLFNIFLDQGSGPWYFQLDNYNSVANALSTRDAEIFFMNMENFDMEDFILRATLGGRRFLLKEDPSTIPYAIKKVQIWWLVTTIIKWCFILFLIYYMIPQSYTDHLQSYLRTSNPVYAISSDEMKVSDSLETNT